MLTSKQRASLRAMANSYETILQVGKDGINDQTLSHIEEALEVRELIKCRVLETSPTTARETANIVAEKIGADVVQVIGYRFVLYRQSSKKENRKIILKK